MIASTGYTFEDMRESNSTGCTLVFIGSLYGSTCANIDSDRVVIRLAKEPQDPKKRHIPFYRPLYANVALANRTPRPLLKDKRHTWAPLMGKRTVNRSSRR